MNIKKGLFRVFIVGLIVSSVVGYFLGLSNAAPAGKNSIEILTRIQADLSKEYCQGLLNKAPAELAKDPPNQQCLYLSIYWNDLKKFQNQHLAQYPEINSKLADEMIGGEFNRTKNDMALIGIGNACIAYLWIWAIGLVLFYIFRWIKRGFNS